MASPFTPFAPAPEPDYSEEVQSMKEYYDSIKAQDIDADGIFPVSEADQGMSQTLADVGNLLFGDTANALGVFIDKDGLHGDIEKGKDFWSEHPVRATLGFATAAASAWGVVAKNLRTARLAEISDNALLDHGFMAPDVNPALVDDISRETMRINVDHVARYHERNEGFLRLGENASPKEKANYYLNKLLANKYVEDTGLTDAFDARKEWRQNVARLFEPKGPITKYLENMPPDEIGPALGMYLNDPTNLNLIPKKWQPMAVMMAEDFRANQSAMVAEGAIFQSEAAHVGDLWFPTTTPDTKIDLGPYTSFIDKRPDGSARMIKVPRTSSPNLLQRKASQEDVRLRTEKQYASSLLSEGKTTEALSILKGERFKDVRGLIDENDLTGAIKALSTDGLIDYRPESLTMRGLFQQRVNLENLRMFRDLSMNPDITKTADYVMGLAPRKRKNWISLDTLDNSDRIRNMVAVKKGVDPATIQSLGYVPKSIFRELREIYGGPAHKSMGESMGDLMTLLTSIYKTVKTALNPPTQFGNIGGNYILLANAGVNPLSKEFNALLGKSTKAVWGSMKAARRRELTPNLGDLGDIESLVGGKKISIADELNSEELKSLVELQSIQTAEGVGVISRLAQSDDFTGAVARLANKAFDMKVPRNMADAYLAADAIPKMAYYLHLRQRGFSRVAATMEVGRRLPMYSTVGDTVAGSRKWLFPWVTFPAEIARIMKNNLMDHPLKTAMFLQMPQMMQVGAYLPGAMGVGPRMSAESIRERRDQLPAWANKASTIMTSIADRNGDFRAMTLDFLPYSSVMPPTVSKDAPMFKSLPFGLDEPMPLLSGLWLAATGKDAWGREIPTDPDQPSQKVGNIMMNFMNFLAPPWMSKYLFDANQVEFGYRFLQDAGRAVNPYTEKAGDPVFDMIINNLSPVKMYPSNPEQQIANESFYRSQLQTFRGKLSKEFNALLKSGHTEGAAEKMKEIAITFEREFKGDPELAERKKLEWMKSQKKRIRQHPQLRSFSEQDIEYQIKRLENETPRIRSKAKQQLIEAYRTELRRRGRKSNGGKKNPFLP